MKTSTHYPPDCPIFSDGIPGMRDWLVAVECEHGHLRLELFADDDVDGIMRLVDPCVVVYPIAAFQFLTPHTRAARDMMKIARGGK